MKKTMIAAGLAAMTLAATQAPVAAATYDRATLQEDVDAIHAMKVPGVLAAAHTGRGSLIARSGLADLTAERPVPYGGYFRMGSTSKTFTATVVLQLVGEGRLSLDDTVEKWLPGVVQGNGNDGSKITVRHLLQQTSGLAEYVLDLPGWTTKDYREHRYDSYTPEQLVAIAMRHKPSWLPGSGEQRWGYSNTNYVLAGMIIKKVTGRAWSQEVRDRIIRPLGLRHTFSPGTNPHLPKPHASGYTEFPDSTEPVNTTDLNVTFAGAAGDLITTASDLTRFWKALLGGKLLKPAQLTAMKQTVPAPGWNHIYPGARYGLGIAQFQSSCGSTYWGHPGNAPGYATRSFFTEDGRRGMVVFMTLFIPNGRAIQVDKRVNEGVDHLMCDTR
ncbi:serine hydrolase domain-containing protein [Nonomuraea sp. bgisy101]|uniref:serine hydrolase domain-containing protein n=1 Tax=Nonomuraea sp. bgisy101 TaxID=3413784 RepID=UPI003D707856